MKLSVKYILYLLLISLSFKSIGQTYQQPGGPFYKENRDLNTWFLSTINFKFAEKWSADMELHERFNSTFSKQGHYIIRPAINYHYTPNVRFTAGYSFIDFEADEFYGLPINRYEHNVWEQAMFNLTVGKTTIVQRFRQEHKWPQNITTITGVNYTEGYGYLNRFRIMVLLQRDIIKLKEDRSIFAVMLDEVWINQNSILIPTSVNRNWFALGCGYKFNKDHNIQLRYMHQYDIASNNTFITTHIGQLVYLGNLDLRKKRR